MNRYTKHATKFIAIAMMLCTLTACPPEDAGERQAQAQPVLHDVKEYWPRAEGNYWHMLPRFGDYEYTYEVVEDYSTKKIEAWAVRHRAYDNQGFVVIDQTRYYIFHQDFLAFVTDKDVLFDILDNPGEPLPYNGVTIVAPRYFYEGLEPRDYLTSLQGVKRYTIAGPLQDILGDMICPQFDDPIPPEQFPVESDRQSLVTTEDGYCGAEPALRGQALFARGVGPLQYGGRTLVYANVDGVEYAL